MKLFLISIFSFFFIVTNIYANSWQREASGFSEVEEFTYDDNKVIHYKNTTTWKDTIGNYGTSKCYGLIVSDNKNIISDYKMYCNFMDQDEDEYTHQYFRDTQFEGGVGKSLLVGGTGKWKKHIGVNCTYAIDYFKQSLFLLEKCNLK